MGEKPFWVCGGTDRKKQVTGVLTAGGTDGFGRVNREERGNRKKEMEKKPATIYCNKIIELSPYLKGPGRSTWVWGGYSATKSARRFLNARRPRKAGQSLGRGANLKGCGKQKIRHWLQKHLRRAENETMRDRSDEGKKVWETRIKGLKKEKKGET